MRAAPSVVVPAFFSICLLASAATAAGNSTQAAHRLLEVLDAAKLDAIAAPDPSEPGAFVAALHIPGSQLLVVRARHPSTDALAGRLAGGQFRDIYIDLQATPTTEGKLFVMDAG